ncbi:O-fucosyltransferase 20 [Camellia lanceoleosa]|uniref:O-fucosyltransferase 20 n=1 Tax=Camellia lanceoleosa TaxID=1840588 RepID=A0ACC0IU82_9ERIC|nr:O-fucosyltransferase 20 [Camellia lanceoleosa]
MAKSKKQAYISVPSQIISTLSSSSLQSLLLSPKKSSKNKTMLWKNPRFWFLSLFLCAFLGMLKMWFNLDPLVPFSPNPCSILHQEPSFRDAFSISQIHNNGGDVEKRDEEQKQEQEQSEFWKQPDGLGYKPCLDFTREYKKWSGEIVKDRKNYLMVVVSGGMNQQRNQIVDAVVIARILGAALVVPVLQVNVIWGDESEFSDIFDLEHFKKVLANDVRIVSSLPSTHLMSRPVEDRQMPVNVSPQWIRAHYHRRLRRDGVLLIRGFDSKLSKDLPSDLQKLRCKVAFQALKFAPPILELGNKLTERMRSKGPYLALHLRLEKDVGARTGCLPLLTSKSKMTYHERKFAGLCPLNALDVTRSSKECKNILGWWESIGRKEALLPLIREFPNLYNKEDLVLPGELEPFASKASVLAAIDYIVADNSDVFMPSHGGNMGHAIQGHRAFAGHKKYITPNKRQMLPYFLNASLPEAEFNRIIMDLHQDSLGQPDLRTSKAGRDVTKFPAPGCMCNDSNSHSS